MRLMHSFLASDFVRWVSFFVLVGLLRKLSGLLKRGLGLLKRALFFFAISFRAASGRSVSECDRIWHHQSSPHVPSNQQDGMRNVVILNNRISDHCVSCTTSSLTHDAFVLGQSANRHTQPRASPGGGCLELPWTCGVQISKQESSAGVQSSAEGEREFTHDGSMIRHAFHTICSWAAFIRHRDIHWRESIGVNMRSIAVQ